MHSRSPIRVLVTGANGQVGHALAQAAPAGTLVTSLDRRALDLTDPAALRRAPAGFDVVINAAAYTAVDKAESEPDLARAVNAAAPAALAQGCAEAGAVLLHVSTDYVFDGTKDTAWTEDDPIRPLGVYGATKAAGEDGVRRALPRHVILRTAWVFAGHGNNFVRTMLRLSRSRRELRVVADQRGGPTPAEAIAAALHRIAQATTEPAFDAFGTYHFAGAPETTWHGFASAILAGRDVTVTPITTSEYPTPASRPANSVLNCSRARHRLGIGQPDWRQALPGVIATLDAALDREGA